MNKQIFCTDANMCAILAKCNPQNKWELWGLSGVSETGEAEYKTRLFENHEFDEVEPINTTSGHTHIKVLKDNNWSEITFIEYKKAADKPVQPEWVWNFPPSPLAKTPPYLILDFDYKDENESIESLVERGAGNNPTVIIDQINAAENYRNEYNERLYNITDYFLKNGTDVNAKDEWGDTALTAASYFYDVHIVNLLLQNGAKINEKNNYNFSAMKIACSALNIVVVNALLREGAEVDSDCFLTLFYGRYSSEDELQNQIELSKLLLNKNIDVNSRDSNGRTALMYIVEAGYGDYYNSGYYNSEIAQEKQRELIQFLLDNGADINAQDNEGKTALMYAIEAECKDVAKYLLEHGADANIKDNKHNLV